MTPIVKIAHSPETLHNKPVTFRVRAYHGDPLQEIVVDGNGTFLLTETNKEGEYEATISVSFFDGSPSGAGTWKMTQVELDQRSVDCLSIEADGSLRCFDLQIPVV
jgi:hypothetical protein